MQSIFPSVGILLFCLPGLAFAGLWWLGVVAPNHKLYSDVGMTIRLCRKAAITSAAIATLSLFMIDYDTALSLSLAAWYGFVSSVFHSAHRRLTKPPYTT